MHLLINIPARDIDILILIPFSLNTDLQLFLAPYPEELTYFPMNQSSGVFLWKLHTELDQDTTAEVQEAEKKDS